MEKLTCTRLDAASNLALYHVGPSLDEGPLPSLFYFALSGPDSLTLDPFNQPIQWIQGNKIRAFSMDLPAHENNLPPTKAIEAWASEYERGQDPLSAFLQKAEKALEFAIEKKLIDPKKIAVAGLSRGGLIALHLAARDPRIRTLAAFAPVVSLKNAKEFFSLQTNPLIEALDANFLQERLYDRRMRIYIGNRDTRVSTRASFDFALALAEKAYEHKIRSPQIEFIMSPSIGQMGHGTAPEIFKQGAEWILECLKK